MSSFRRSLHLVFLAIIFHTLSFSTAFAETAQKAMVATAHPLATEAALGVLKEGGNAAEAAIAAQWVLNVVEPQSSGIGGGGFFLYYDAETKGIFTFDGREKAPQDLSPDVFLDENGEPIPFFPDRITGGMPVGVPGTLRLLKKIHEKFSSGKYTFGDLFEPAIRIAESGFKVSNRLSRMIQSQKDRLILFEDSKNTFLDIEGNAISAGTLLKQPDLAKTFRLIQNQGISVFYEGEIADDIVNAVRYSPQNPGLMTRRDLFYYKVIERDAVYGRYRGFDIFSMGPPSSGGLTLLETLNILSFFDVRGLGRKKDFIHLFSEAQKLAFQDRNEYMGDSDFVPVPMGFLLSDELADEHASKIRPNSTLPTQREKQIQEGTQTSHISIVDEKGNMVSFTTTIEHVFGSALMVPGRGFILNNELTDFDAMPFGFEGKPKANQPDGEKRPRSSMTPTFVFKEGKPFLIVGSPGGSTIISTVLNIIVNIIDFEMSLDAAMRAPRILNRDGPVELETTLYLTDGITKSLEEKGNKVKRNRYFGNAQAILFDHRYGVVYGESDSRGEGLAAGY